MRGCAELSTSGVRRPHVQGAPARWAVGGGAEGRGAEIPRGMEINKFGTQATGQLLPPLRAS